jgi:hypothetical protein
MADKLTLDYDVLIVVVVFLSAFILISTQFNTEFLKYTVNNQYAANWNGTLYSNLTSGTQQGAIPTPPTCNAGYVIIDGALGCGAGYLGYFWNIMTFRSDIAFLNIIIITPLLILLGYLIINLLIRIADLLPFT